MPEIIFTQAVGNHFKTNQLTDGYVQMYTQFNDKIAFDVAFILSLHSSFSKFEWCTTIFGKKKLWYMYDIDINGDGGAIVWNDHIIESAIHCQSFSESIQFRLHTHTHYTVCQIDIRNLENVQTKYFCACIDFVCCYCYIVRHLSQLFNKKFN